MPDINLLPQELVPVEEKPPTKKVLAAQRPVVLRKELAGGKKARSVRKIAPVQNARVRPKKIIKEETGFGVNLIQEIVAPAGRPALGRRLFWGLVIILVEAAIIGAVFFLFRQFSNAREAEINQLSSQIEQIKSEAAAFTDDIKKSDLIRKQLSSLGTILDRHIYWSEFFKFLEGQTLPDIFYTSLGADGEIVTLVGRATDYSTVAKQLLVFSQSPELIRDVSITGINFVDQETEEGRIKILGFNLTLRLAPTLLRDL